MRNRSINDFGSEASVKHFGDRYFVLKKMHRRQSWEVGGRDPQILKWGSLKGVGGSWRVWFQVFCAVKGRDGNPVSPIFKPD
jgi:hypothetical protein